jgi:aminopeptidase N
MLTTTAAVLLVTSHFAPQEPSPGISRELAAARTAAIRDVEYDLRFTITDSAERADGELFLRFRLADDRNPGPVVLDWRGETLGEVNLNGRVTTLLPVDGHFVLPPDLLVRGKNGLKATFTSRVAATGTPLTIYRDPQDGRPYLYTLLVPADAHGLFPCFDQPDLRARFTLELDLPPGWTAVANTSRITEPERRPTPVRGRLWRFRPTKPLPTYLFAFACGPFAEVEAPHPRLPGVTADEPMRFLLRASRRTDFDRDALVRLHHDGLRWLSRSFGVPYPFDKLDVVLLPGFPYGGMEHAGAIFYRETALVFDHPPTPAELVRRSTLIYHEIAHQWFGNLVTMRWFDDLWLKEGFATFYAYRALEALEPGQRSWLRFLQRVKPRAYEVDGTPGSTPVFQELQNLADAKSAYGPIVYNKAPAVLRALFEQLGERAFESGVKAFLEKHAFGNADWRDLARALEQSGRRDLARWSQRWLLTESMPQVRVAWTVGDDGRVATAELRQKAVDGGDGTWPLDVELLVVGSDGERTTIVVRSDGAAAAIPELAGKAPPAAVLVNPRDVAYGQFVPDPSTREWLLANGGTLEDPLVRASAAAALFEAVREAELDPLAYARLASSLLAAERDPDTHGWLLDALGTCLWRYADDDRAASLRAELTAELLRQLRDEADSGRELGTLRFLARHARDEAVLALCRAVVDGGELPKGLVPGRQDCFLAAAALLAAGAADEDPVARLEARFQKEDVAKEAFLARAATPTAEAKARYWQLYLQPDAPPEQWTQDSLSWFHWPGQGELTLPYLAKALQQVEWVKRHRRIFFMPAWLDAFVNAHDSPEALAVVDHFLGEQQLTPDIRQKLLQSRDGLARTVRIRAAFR